MRSDDRRKDVKSAAKLDELRKMMRAFGRQAAKRLAERDVVPPALLQVALNLKFERRRELRRSEDWS